MAEMYFQFKILFVDSLTVIVDVCIHPMTLPISSVFSATGQKSIDTLGLRVLHILYYHGYQYISCEKSVLYEKFITYKTTMSSRTYASPKRNKYTLFSNVSKMSVVIQSYYCQH